MNPLPYHLIKKAEPNGYLSLKLLFDNGKEVIAGLDTCTGKGISSSLQEESFFRQVKVEDGFLSWPNGFELCPNSLYEKFVAPEDDELLK